MKSTFSLIQKAILIFCFALAVKPVSAQMFYLTHGGIQRSYEVVLPQNYEPNMPLVIALHGAWGDNSILKEYTGIDQFSDTTGFVVVLPNGIDELWNFGLEYCPIRGNFPAVDDVGFISTLIDILHNDFEIDLERVYCFGWSTGGQMALRLGIQLGNRLAAVASAEGGLLNVANRWSPKRPLPVLEIHGTEDPLNGYYGPLSIQSTEEWSIAKTLDYWVDINQCDPNSDTLTVPDLVPEDSSTVQKIIFSGGKDGVEVIHFKIINGGHAWPGTPSTIPLGIYEVVRNMDINATEEIWNFFKNFSNPDGPDFVLGDLPVIKTNVNIYPNPTNAFINIKVSNSNIIESLIEIVDLKGNIVLVNDFNLITEHQVEQIDVSPLANGLYIIRMIQTEKVAIRKFVVSK